MRTRNKILLVVDSWMLRHDAGPLLDRLAVEGADIIFYHVADYSEAIATSPDQYNETILPGSGILSANQFIAERKGMVDAFLKHCHQVPIPGEVEIEIDPQPAAKILEKAKKEMVDLVILGISHGHPQRSRKSALAEKVVRESGCLVLAVPAKEVSDALPPASGTTIADHASEPITQSMRLSELRQGVYSTPDYSAGTCEHCRHPLELHTSRGCSVCKTFPDSAVGRGCLRMRVSCLDNSKV